MIHSRQTLDFLFDILRSEHAAEYHPAHFISKLHDYPTHQVLKLLDRQGLAPLWFFELRRLEYQSNHSNISNHPNHTNLSTQANPSNHTSLSDSSKKSIPSALFKALEKRYRLSIGMTMLQQNALQRVGEILERKNLSWLVFKGRHLATEIYHDPSHRPSVDIDILVRREQRDEAISHLAQAGFKPARPGDNATHEITLNGFGSSIDLHWQLLRPGRSRIDLAAFALNTRRMLKNGLYAPGILASTVIQLIHPAITEYTTSRLIRVVDLERWLRHNYTPTHIRSSLSSFPPSSSAPTFPSSPSPTSSPTSSPSTSALSPSPHSALIELLDKAGLKTAAWAMLYWTRQWTRNTTAQSLFEQLTPGPLLRNYLKLWLQLRPLGIPILDGILLDPTTIYKSHPLIAKAGYSLMLNDTWTQRIRSILDLEKGLRKLGETGER